MTRTQSLVNATPGKEAFLACFERFEKETGEGDFPWLRRIRNAAIARFDELGLPGARTEDWRFTNITPLARVVFDYRRPEAVQIRPGGALPEGVVVDRLAAALRKHPHQVEPYLARSARVDDNAFTALNTAFIEDGVFLFIPDGAQIAEPIEIEFANPAASGPVLRQPRCLIVAGKDSRATIIERHSGRGVYFANVVTELYAGRGAAIDHYKLQQESSQAFHVANLQVTQEPGSRFSTHYVGLGGALVRNEVRVLLDGEGSEATVNGLYLADRSQHMDNHTVIEHAKPHCASHELYKGILGGKSHGVFNGKIFVRQDAQKTDAKQTNQTLLLSEDAVINTKPQLEIYADDVKCTHGATVGQLDENAIFYLRSRGLGLEAAQDLLTYAFANDIIGRIQVEGLRRQLEELLLTRPAGGGRGGAHERT